MNVTGIVEPASAMDGSNVTVLPAEMVAKDALLERTVSAGEAKYALRPRMLFLPAGITIEVGVADAELARVAVAPTDELVEVTTLKLITTVYVDKKLCTVNVTGTMLPTYEAGKLTVISSPSNTVANPRLLAITISTDGFST